MQAPPDRLETLLAARAERELNADERAELVGLLRECGRVEEAEAVLAEPEPTTAEPAPAEFTTPQHAPVQPELLPRWMVWVAAAGLVCVLAAVLVPLAVRSRQANDEALCRERLRRLAFALRLAVDAADGRYPAPNTDLVALLAPYQVRAEDLRCPTGATYRLNPMLAGQRQSVAAGLPSCALLVEVRADGTPAPAHRGVTLGVLTSGWVGELDSVARASLGLALPSDEPPGQVAAAPPPSPPAKATTTAAAAPTAGTAPSPTAPPGPLKPAKPSTIPPTQPENERAGPDPAGGGAYRTRPASSPEVLPGDSSPPESRSWQEVLTLRGHDLATSQPFAAGAQARVRFETHTNELGPQPFRLLLVDEVGARPLRVLAVGVGPNKGVVEVGGEGRFRIRMITVQPYTITVEDRR